MRSPLAPSFALALLVGCAPAVATTAGTPASGPDLQQIIRDARALADDSMRGRGPFTPENEKAARYLADRLAAIGARPLVASSMLVPFVTDQRPNVIVYNVAGILPSKSGAIDGRTVGITAHFDHLGVGAPDSTGDTIYNGFLDDAIGVGMSLDVARRYAAAPGDRPLIVMFFNLEEQGLLGAKALAARPDLADVIAKMNLLVGVDAGSPAGEAIDWQLMGALPEHAGTRIADSIAITQGWAVTFTPPRAISDVYPFSQKGVPILFPIPGQRWRNYTAMERNQLMRRFDHYHSPGDEYDPAFPLTGTQYFADYLWAIIREAASRP